MKSTLCNNAYNGSSTMCCIQFMLLTIQNNYTVPSDILHTEAIFSLTHCQ